MDISAAVPSDVDETVACLIEAFAKDPITGYLLDAGPGYPARVGQFFSLLMRARIALGMPVLVARDGGRVLGAAMGYSTARLAWPRDIADAWDRFEQGIAGLATRMAVYDAIADGGKPDRPHYYLGVIGVHPDSQGRGLGSRLLTSFCALSARDPLSTGVYLETASPSNVGFYEHAGFRETARGPIGDATLWGLFLPHDSR